MLTPTYDIASSLNASKQFAEKIAAALRISELQYRRLFEAARDGILILDSDFGRITHANPFMTELLGYSHEDLIGKNLCEVGLFPDEQANWDAMIQLKQEQHLRCEDMPVDNGRGERRHVKLISSVYHEAGHMVIQCNIRDITARKLLEAELAATAAKNERIAGILQGSMLQRYPAGKFPGLSLETLYQAALDEADVGGDFFDAFAVTGNRVAMVVGDVSGKGLIAAGRTTEIKYALRAYLHDYHSPGIALAHLNNFICETHRLDRDSGETFIILALVVVNTITGETVFSAAGAEPSLILLTSGAVKHIETFGQGLGMFPGADYESKTITLQSGETLLMTTDGILEARCGSEFLGLSGLVTLLESLDPAMPLSDLVKGIYEGACEYTDRGFRDDICLLAARRQ